jgi:hypothetical protein
MKIKIGLTLLAIVIACMQSNAQLKIFGIGPYAELATPVGDMKETNKGGIGAGLAIDIRLSKIALIGSAGFLHFGGRDADNEGHLVSTPAINAIPIRVGLKYYMAHLFYLKLESGTANYLGGDKTAVIFSPGIGIRLLGLDVQAKYESWIKNGSNNFWGLKAGYSF